MTLRKIIRIDEEKCNGCGECVTACSEGAIKVIDGKARLVSEIYCDGLGDCLGKCPEDAITIEEREAEPFDQKKAEAHIASITSGNTNAETKNPPAGLPGMCPGSMIHQFNRKTSPSAPNPGDSSQRESELANWPVQLKLVFPQSPCFDGADLLFVADCVPFALADFHKKILRGNPVIIGCPKFDDVFFYIDKLAQILEANDVKSITIVHMEVPCCSTLLRIVEKAIAQSQKEIPVKDMTVTVRGEIL